MHVDICRFMHYVLGHRLDLVEEYFEASLNDLGLDYVDMYLLHTPFAFAHVPGDLHPKNPDGSIRVDTSTDLLGVWKVIFLIILLTKFLYLYREGVVPNAFYFPFRLFRALRTMFINCTKRFLGFESAVTYRTIIITLK